MARFSYLTQNGQWVGPPVLILALSNGSKEVIDGRKRLAEIERRGLNTTVPRLVTTSFKEAIAKLIDAGHYERAIDLATEKAPNYLVKTTEEFATLTMGLPPWRVQAYIRKFRNRLKLDPKPRRAINVVKRVVRLKIQSMEGKEITLKDIIWALGEFNAPLEDENDTKENS